MANFTPAIATARGIRLHRPSLKYQQNGFVALPAPESPWETLGLEPGAAFAEIESAYREKAKLCHPDHGGSHRRIAQLDAARSELLHRRTA